MLPQSTSFSDDTTMKSSGPKGALEDTDFIMKKLGEIRCQLGMV